MNRRNFLRLFGVGLPATVVAEKLGLIERVRSYFFAPKQGWFYPAQIPQEVIDYQLRLDQIMALQREAMLPYINNLIEAEDTLAHYIGGSEARPLTRKRWRTAQVAAHKSEYPEIDFEKALLIGNA